MHLLLQGLTPAQREAVQHTEGPLLVLAGPGSGKTRVITHRIAWLLEQGVLGHQILALTFTNKAAEEMRTRVQRLAPDQSVWVGTYHRFCARLLRQYAPLVGIEENFTIYDAEDSARALQRVLAQLQTDLVHFTPERIASVISWAKNNLIGPDEYEARAGNPLGAIVQRAYPAYQAQLARWNAADFDDLLLYVANLLRHNPEIRQALDGRYRYVLVDEYQDTNLAQYAIARAMSIDHPNLAVTGDPDQSIYGWRGANLKNILEFEHDYPDVRVVRLERNYRSTKRILRVAAELIGHNLKRKQKDLYTENGEGVPVRLVSYATERDEAQQIAARIAEEVHAGRRRPRDYAIFYRVNALSRALESALREYGVPCQLVRGVEFFRRKEIRDILAYLQLVNNPNDDLALLRVINTPPRGIGKTTVERLADYATHQGLTLLEAARRAGQLDSLSKKAKELVKKFVEMYARLAAVAAGPVEEILGYVLTESGYKTQFESDNEEDQQHLANIEELLTVARDFDERHADHRVGKGDRTLLPERPDGCFAPKGPVLSSLEEFLEETSLVADTDDWEAATDRVTLMTLHASKGLEFPVVYLTAVEQGLLPHERSREDSEQLEEERRLMFVGITRAQEELQISRAEHRDFRGQRKTTVPSMFLMELPRCDMDVEQRGLAPPEHVEEFYQAPRRPSEPPRPVRMLSAAPLTTAAELANGGPMPAVDPDEFHQGMLVRHPEHGLGRIIALSGSGSQRRATVEFVSAAGEKRFVIAASPLRPVKAK